MVLSATSSAAEAAPSAPHQVRFQMRHTGHANRLAPAKQTKTATKLNCIVSCTAYASTINQFFTDVAADNGLETNVYSAATQYSSIEYDETFGGSYMDGNPYPTTNTCQDGWDTYCVTDAQLQTEIGKVIAKNHWPTQSSTALYFVFTPANVGICIKAGSPNLSSNPCTTNVFCAYHSATDSFPSATKSFIYAVEPDAAAISDEACVSGSTPAGNSADDTISTVSHEHNEAITDPLGDGWWTEDHETYLGTPDAFFGAENGDLCAYNFGTALGTTLSGQPYNQVINGHDYYLQQEWSDVDGGCVQHLGGTATNFPSTHPLYEGTGPLVYHNGPVMTTNTVYAIYWVPARPVNIKPPAITGITKVGKKLTASHGTWSNLPKFTYRWLRCSSAGTSCKGISSATKSSYTLVKADAHHKIEVRVTARNMAGIVSKVSAPSTIVKS